MHIDRDEVDFMGMKDLYDILDKAWAIRLKKLQKLFGDDFQGRRKDLPRLKELLDSENAEVRAAAIDAIGRCCTIGVKEDLARRFVEMYRRDEDVAVREEAIHAISWCRPFLGKQYVADMFIEVVFNPEEDPSVRERAYIELLDFPRRQAYKRRNKSDRVGDFVFYRDVDFMYIESLKRGTGR